MMCDRISKLKVVSRKNLWKSFFINISLYFISYMKKHIKAESYRFSCFFEDYLKTSFITQVMHKTFYFTFALTT